MKTITLQQAKSISFQDLHIALGTFDGLHIGHVALVDAVKNREGQSAVFTFDALPVDLFQTGHKPMRLYTIDKKIASFEKTGIDYLCMAHFDDAFAHMDKADFEQLLHDVFAPAGVVAGFNYTYGRQAEGSANTLIEAGIRHGYSVEVIPPVIKGGQPISSTRIRECIWDGDIQSANALLGYTFSISGVVVHGKGIGRQMGFPTANICAAAEKIVPKNGVYSVEVYMDGKHYKGVCSIGTNPTVAKHAKQSIEVHILQFDTDIYDQEITVRFLKRIRDERRFGSREQLVAQIAKDIRSVAKE